MMFKLLIGIDTSKVFSWPFVFLKFAKIRNFNHDCLKMLFPLWLTFYHIPQCCKVTLNLVPEQLCTLAKKTLRWGYLSLGYTGYIYVICWSSCVSPTYLQPFWCKDIFQECTSTVGTHLLSWHSCSPKVPARITLEVSGEWRREARFARYGVQGQPVENTSDHLMPTIVNGGFHFNDAW